MMDSFWSGWITVITLGTIFGCAILLFGNRKVDKPGQATGHKYDGIEEYDNPLPGWWFGMFVITIIFALAYLVIYPGLGNYKGMIGWTSVGQWETEMSKADEQYGPLFAKYSAMPIEDVAKDADALKMGQRMFANNCAVCHGSDAKGGHGFPNLTDNDWLYGGAPETIKASITHGRQGAMPAKGLKPDMTDSEIADLVQYVKSLSAGSKNADAEARGKGTFMMACTACHGVDAKGNQAMGAPNLTDNIWLYGGTPSLIKHTIMNGRQGKMPAHEELLSSDKIHLLASYVYSLSAQPAAK
jgi:cytochrome c oxidase cbb3-type subunit 3